MLTENLYNGYLSTRLNLILIGLIHTEFRTIIFLACYKQREMMIINMYVHYGMVFL